MALSPLSELGEATLANWRTTFTEKNSFFRGIEKFDQGDWKTMEDWSERLYVHLDQSRVEICFFGELSAPDDRLNRSYQSWLLDVKKNYVDNAYTFRDVHKRLSANNKLSSEGRKNADLREFRWYGDIHMVKRFFTLGFQNLRRECYDLLVTTNKPVDVYLLRPGEVPLESRVLPEYGEEKFRLRRVLPHTLLLLTPGTKYILIAPDKCIFYFKKFSDRQNLEAELGLQTASGVTDT